MYNPIMDYFGSVYNHDYCNVPGTKQYNKSRHQNQQKQQEQLLPLLLLSQQFKPNYPYNNNNNIFVDQSRRGSHTCHKRQLKYEKSSLFFITIVIILVLAFLSPEPAWGMVVVVPPTKFSTSSSSSYLPIPPTRISWQDLEDILFPTMSPTTATTTASTGAATTTEQLLETPTPTTTTRKVRLYRERHGWCIYSARLWLALEIKGIVYDTILVDAQGDTFDGGEEEEDDDDDSSNNSHHDMDNDDHDSGSGHRHRCLDLLNGYSLPVLQVFSNDNDNNTNNHDNIDDDETTESSYKLYEASKESTSIALLQELDVLFPESKTKLFFPIHENENMLNDKSNKNNDDDSNNSNNTIIYKLCKAFEESVPTGARKSPRAAWLFCNEEGYRLDALPRSTFELFLNKTETLLSIKYTSSISSSPSPLSSSSSSSPSGPFFGGSHQPSAADIVWAPLLERYSVQLPCLHQNLMPRQQQQLQQQQIKRRSENPINATTKESETTDTTTTSTTMQQPLLLQYPNLSKWYDAMDTIPSYVCRIKGDGPSWRRVLYSDPWWPRADLWHPRDTVGPKGELFLTEEECCTMMGDNDNNNYNPSATSIMDDFKIWDEYAQHRPNVSKMGPGTDVAISLTRNRIAILKDATKWIEYEGYDVSTITTTSNNDDNNNNNNDYGDDHPTLSTKLDVGLRAIAWMLWKKEQQRRNASLLQQQKEEEMVESISNNNYNDNNFDIPIVALLLLYLDERLCVPRDMGAPSAAALRMLRKEIDALKMK